MQFLVNDVASKTHNKCGARHVDQDCVLHWPDHQLWQTVETYSKVRWGFIVTLQHFDRKNSAACYTKPSIKYNRICDKSLTLGKPSNNRKLSKTHIPLKRELSDLLQKVFPAISSKSIFDFFNLKWGYPHYYITID